MTTTQPSHLHFDLSGFSPDLEFRVLHGVKGGTPLARYADAPSKLEEHRAANAALAAIPDAHLAKVTHYVEDIHVPTRGIYRHQVVFPSFDDHPLPELAMVFAHIGEDDVMHALTRTPAYQDKRTGHLVAATYDVDQDTLLRDYSAIHIGAATIKPPGVTAQDLVRSHPEIGTVNGVVAKYVLDTYVSDGIAFSELVQYLQENGPGTDEQWYNKSWSMWAPNGGPMVPAVVNTDIKFGPLKETPDWPTPPGSDKPGMPTYVLTDEYDPPAKTKRGAGVVGAAAPVVQQVLRQTKADETLNGVLWSKQNGTTEKGSSTTTPVQRLAPLAAAQTSAPAAVFVGEASNAKGFALKDVTSAYGLYSYPDEMAFDAAKRTLTLPVKNWFSRYLGAYVEFQKQDGTPIKRTDITAANPANPGTPYTWTDNLPFEGVRSFVEPSDTKNYLTWLSSGSAIFGAPCPPLTQKSDLTFLWPDAASRAVLLFGGLGCAAGFSDWDSDVDIVGVLGTGIVNYGVGVALLFVGVYVINPIVKYFKDEWGVGFYAIAGTIGATGLIVGTAFHDTSFGKAILSKLAGFAASAIFGSFSELVITGFAKKAAEHMAEAAGELAAEMTAEQALEQIPAAGWALKIASIAADVVALAATTVECVISPATYELDVLRTMDLTVTVSPDPRHGKKGFEPVWPLVSDHYVVRVTYPGSSGSAGGTTYTLAGPMPGAHDAPITVTFTGIPAGGKVDVTGNIYSSNDWLCGRWDSGWINAVPDDNSKLSAGGAIKEELVPLTPTTTYSQKQTLAYSAAAKHHWAVYIFTVDGALTGDFDKGGAPSAAIMSAFAANGNTVGANAAITVAKRHRKWTLADPTSGMTFDVTAKPILATELFDLTLATFRDGLDQGGATPAALATAFADNGYKLPDGTEITVVTLRAEWAIGLPGGQSLYVLKSKAPNIVVSQSAWELAVRNSSDPVPPLPATYPLTAGPTGNQLGALQNIIHNNREYQLGYSWMAAGQNLPVDGGDQPQNTPMYAMQSISTLGQPQDQIIEPTRGFSLPTLIAYDQFGLSELFPLDAALAGNLAAGPVAKPIADEFAGFGRTLPTGAEVAVVTAGSRWTIGAGGADPLYQLDMVTEDDDGTKKQHIAVFAYPVPRLDNFYLDPRSHTSDNPVYYLRGVPLDQGPGSHEFDYDTAKAWGRIYNAGSLQALAVHPSGYVVAVDFVNHKLYALKLPADAVDSDKAPIALPLSGEGVREGLLANPQALTITADGRILILEYGNRRVQAFDVKGNPVACFSVGQPHFAIAASFAPDLDSHQPSAALLQAFQTNTLPAAAAKFSVSDPGDIVTHLDAGTVDDKLVLEFYHSGYGGADDTSGDYTVTTTQAGKLWSVTNTKSHGEFDVRLLPDRYDIDQLYVFLAPSLSVTTQAKASAWTVEDTTNSTRYQVTAPAAGGDLTVQQLVSYLPLRDQSDTVTYLDIAVEPKGYIYVLMVSETSGKPTFLLDIYNPDGSVLLTKPQSGINAARLTVDQWRTLFTLNFNAVLGPNSRTEPGVSVWQPSTPAG